MTWSRSKFMVWFKLKTLSHTLSSNNIPSRHSWIGHTIKHNEFVLNTLEGAIVTILVIRCQSLLQDLRTIWSWCFYVFYEYYYHIPLHSLRVLLSHSFTFFTFYFLINVYMVWFLFYTVIYVFLLLWLCILIACLCMTTLTKVFPCF